MALTCRGFNGRPIDGATGLKAPLVFDDSTGRYALALSRGLGDWHTEREILDYEERALLTRTSNEAAYVQGLVACYAHILFIAPGDVSSRDLAASPSVAPVRLAVPEELELHPALNAYVGFVEPARATSIQKEWTDHLIGSALSILRDRDLPSHERGKIIFAEAMRARFSCPVSQAAVSTRKEAFALAWVGLRLQGRDSDLLLDDAGLENMRTEVLLRGMELAAAPSPDELARVMGRDRDSLPHRSLGDSQCFM